MTRRTHPNNPTNKQNKSARERERERESARERARERERENVDYLDRLVTFSGNQDKFFNNMDTYTYNKKSRQWQKSRGNRPRSKFCTILWSMGGRSGLKNRTYSQALRNFLWPPLSPTRLCCECGGLNKECREILPHCCTSRPVVPPKIGFGA